MSDIILRTPPVILQGNRHICWASAYAAWAQVSGVNPERATADWILGLLRPIGRTQQSEGCFALDANDRLLPQGVGLFGQITGMRIEQVLSRRFTAAFLRNRINHGHVWLWGTPVHGSVAHIVVVYGITDSGMVLIMDPLTGLLSNSVQAIRARFRIFGVGTHLYSPPSSPANIFRGLSEPAAPAPQNPANPIRPANDLFPGRG